MPVTSTNALTETILLSSGYNASDLLVTAACLVGGLFLFAVFAWLIAAGLPLREGS